MIRVTSDTGLTLCTSFYNFSIILLSAVSVNETGTLGIFLTQSIVQKTGNLEVKPGANTPETQFFPLQKIKCFVFFPHQYPRAKGHVSSRSRARGFSIRA